ncbi:MAG TPA: T9SS type A sorting domain-containing protein [Bacteroidota bacterium]|nr:T9SS type A sorting domain-containing protein [Bacteroidota bacterium]
MRFRTVFALCCAAALGLGVASAQPERIGVHKVIPPLRSTLDTLGFFPPGAISPSGSNGLSRAVQRVAVRLDTVNFPLDEALDILLHHGGLVDTLVHGLRIGGSNFRNARLIDTAHVAVDTGAPPFTGDFSPAHPLSAFDGSEASGLWVLEIYNHSPDRMGVLEQWGVSVEFTLTLTSVGSGGNAGPSQFSLSQNYPNPFNPSTIIPYSLAEKSTASLAIFNTLGELVTKIAVGEQDPGPHEVRLDASKLSSGVYYYRLQAGRYAATKSLVVLK